MALFHYSFWFLSLLSLGLAADTVSFIYPGPLTNPEPKANTFPILKVGQVVDISWTSSETVDLIINQRNSPSTQIDRTPNSENINANTYKWKVNVDGTDGGAKFDLAFNNQFNFLLFKHGATSVVASSSWFNISDSTIDAHGVRISSTTSSSSTTSISSSTSTSTSSASTTTTSPATIISQKSTPTTLGASASTAGAENSASLNPTSSTGLSTGAKAAIGAVIGVAAIAIIGLIFFFLRRRKAKKDAAKPDEFADTDTPYQDNAQMGQAPAEMSSPGPQFQTKVPHPAEVSGYSRPTELHGSAGMYGAYGTRPTELP